VRFLLNLALCCGLITLSESVAQESTSAPSGSTPVAIIVKVPESAKLTIDGHPVSQTGAERRLLTPPLPVGKQYKYTLVASYLKDGKTVTITKEIIVEPLKTTYADLTGEGFTKLPEPKKEEPKKEEPKKEEPKKEEPKKVDPPKKEIVLDVPFVPTPEIVVKKMLETAGVKEGEIVYDLGCGDGRIVISAVKDFKAKKAIGIDLDPERIKESKENAKKAGVEGKCEFKEGDVLKIKDVSEANVVTLYLLPDINRKIAPMLKSSLKPGSRIVSHDFTLADDWKAEKEISVKDNNGREHSVYLYVVPEAKKPEPKKEEPKKVEQPKKEEPKKVDPKNEETIKVPYVPTPHAIVTKMLQMAKVTDKDVVYDLGCGDGRIVVSAVKDFKAKKGVGIDLNPERIKESKENAKKAKVEDKCEFREGDVLKIKDLSEASVVTLYMFPEVNQRLAPILKKTLKPGSRIVSHDFDMGDEWKPDETITIKDDEGIEHFLFIWKIK
jgi:uncharacterized protein (TIGR03000 family)